VPDASPGGGRGPPAVSGTNGTTTRLIATAWRPWARWRPTSTGPTCPTAGSPAGAAPDGAWLVAEIDERRLPAVMARAVPSLVLLNPRTS
jgi:hypothetical protein